MSEIRYDERRPMRSSSGMDCSVWMRGKLTQLAHDHRVRLVDVTLDGAIGGPAYTLVAYVGTVANVRFEDAVRGLFPDGQDLRFENVRP